MASRSRTKTTSARSSAAPSPAAKWQKALSLLRTREGIVGRDRELEHLWLALSSGRNVLLEGPVGVGKTALAQAVAHVLGKPVIRVDGDGRYTEQKLVGSFDPATAMERGYSRKTFLPGPLVQAMEKGAILFINELNRMPESVQNVLLPALDEGVIQIPNLGTQKAKAGFQLIATQNPREFVATSHLSEAMQDRLEWIGITYPPVEEELAITRSRSSFSTEIEPFIEPAVELARLTRSNPKIKRGASIRAAISLVTLLEQRHASFAGELTEEDFWQAARLALPTRIELQAGQVAEGAYAMQVESAIQALRQALAERLGPDWLQKKKRT